MKYSIGPVLEVALLLAGCSKGIMRLTSRALLITFCIAGSLLIVGCASSIDLDTARQMIVQSGNGADANTKYKKINYLGDTYRQQAQTDQRNSVLFHLHIGLAALEKGDRQLAAESFDAALLDIEAVYGGDEIAQKARMNYNAESDKVFRGEPYERTMAYYYRGILYLMEDDYENARASFRTAFLQDSLAGSEVYQQDFALLAFLEGWASQCNDDTELAKEAFAVAQKYNSNLKLPAEGADVLVLAEQGDAPIKYAEGEQKELLKIKIAGGGSQGEFYAQDSSGAHKKFPNTESISYQAITRGGREFDAILKGQAHFKESSGETAEVAATVFATAKAAADMLAQSGELTDTLGLRRVAGVAGLVSMVSQAQADKTNPAADIRQWDTLPDRIHYGAYRADQVPAVQYGDYGVEETDTGMKAIFQPVKTTADSLFVQRGGASCKVIWARYTDPDSTRSKVRIFNYPAFMDKLNGCWRETSPNLTSSPLMAMMPDDYKEYKVIGPDTYLSRTDLGIYVVEYQVTGDDTASFKNSARKWRFSNENTIKEGGFLGLATMHRESPSACGGLLLQ